MEDILEHNRDSIVIVDEAYIDFAGRSAVELVDKYDNLIVTQTFSKSRSMAGMRIGYAIASPELIRCLNDVKLLFQLLYHEPCGACMRRCGCTGPGVL